MEEHGARPPKVPLSYLLLALLVVVFFWRGLHEATPELLVRSGGLLKEGGHLPQGQWWRLLTCVFLHNGAPHLLMNALSLHALGPALEAVFGPARLVGFFFLSALCGSWASLKLGGDGMSVGASGGIFGLLGLQLVLGIRLWGHMEGRERRAFALSMGYVLLVNALLGMSNPLLDHAAHGGGFVGGALLCAMVHLGPREPEARRATERRWLLVDGAVLLVLAYGAWRLSGT